MFFKEKGLLWDEFEHLYNTLFSNANTHIAVVEALARKRMGMTRKELVKETGVSDNGDFGKILKNLADNGFFACIIWSRFAKASESTPFNAKLQPGSAKVRKASAVPR